MQTKYLYVHPPPPIPPPPPPHQKIALFKNVFSFWLWQIELLAIGRRLH